MSDSEKEYAGEFAAVIEIAEVLTELVGALTGGQRGVLGTAQVVEMASRAVPRADLVGVLVNERGRVRTVAGNGEVLARPDAIRAETGEGRGRAVAGVRSASGRGAGHHQHRDVPAVPGPNHRAALLVSSRWPHAFDDIGLALGAIFAAYCSLCVLAEVVLGDEVTPRRAA